jgi:hypothetical protein
MNKEFFVFGKNLSPEDATDAYDDMKESWDRSLEPVANELPKTPDELQFIKLIDFYLRQEFAELKIDKEISVSPE